MVRVLIIQCVLILILGGWICFNWLFSVLRQWIVDLNFRLQNKMRKDGQRNRQWLKKHLNLK